jgi:hypothetical protein
MRRIGHFLDQWFGDADSKRLSVPERFASLETAVSEANHQLNSLTRMPVDLAGLPLAPAKALREGASAPPHAVKPFRCQPNPGRRPPCVERR